MKLTPFLVLLFAAIVAESASAADWPQFRGPERTAISEETGLLASWPSGGPQMLWRVDDLGFGYGSLAVVGDRAYLIANRGMGSELIIAVSVADGSEVWTVEMGPVGRPNQEPPYAAARSTPTVVGDTLYAMSSNGDLVSVQASTGEVLWRKDVMEDFGGESGRWAYAESPLVDGEALVVTPGGGANAVLKLDRRSGEKIWGAALPEPEPAGYASTVTAEAAGRRQYIGFLDKGIIGVDAATGETLWRYGRTASGPANIPSPVADGDYVYSSNARRFGGALIRLSSRAGGMAADEVYFQRSSPNTMGGQVLLDGVLYGTNQDGLVATEFASGEVLWQSEGGPGSIQYTDGHFYLHWESGDVSLVEATPEAFRETGRFSPPDPPAVKPGQREQSWSYPAVSNGRLFIRHLGTIWCYDVSASSARLAIPSAPSPQR